MRLTQVAMVTPQLLHLWLIFSHCCGDDNTVLMRLLLVLLVTQGGGTAHSDMLEVLSRLPFLPLLTLGSAKPHATPSLQVHLALPHAPSQDAPFPAHI